MMPISVIVCTRDRPDDLARCLPAVLANDYPDFEVVVVDQSSNDASQQVVASLPHSRLRYHRQNIVGKSRALNLGLGQATGQIIALTDDDCTVPNDWLQRGATVLAKEPDAGIVFGALAAAPHNSREAFIPVFTPPRYRRLRGRFAAILFSMGVGAHMFARRAVFDRIGGYDEYLGPGSTFHSNEDVDLAYRALRADFAVVLDPDNTVLHWGERHLADGSARGLIRNSYYGIGAGLIKRFRCGDSLAALALLLGASRESAFLITNLVRHRAFTGGGRLLYLIMGVLAGLRQPVDRQRSLYLPAGGNRR